MPRKREKKKEAIVVSKPLPAYPLLSAVRFWRRGWLAREKLMAERGGGERKTTTYRRLIGRGVSPIPLDFRTRQKSCLYEEKHFWQPVAISARKRPDIVNGPSSNRRRKREREISSSKLSLIYESSLLFSPNDHAYPHYSHKIEN